MALQKNDLLEMLQKSGVIFTAAVVGFNDGKASQFQVAHSKWDDPMKGRWTLTSAGRFLLTTSEEITAINFPAESDQEVFKKLIEELEFKPAKVNATA